MSEPTNDEETPMDLLIVDLEHIVCTTGDPTWDAADEGGRDVYLDTIFSDATRTQVAAAITDYTFRRIEDVESGLYEALRALVDAVAEERHACDAYQNSEDSAVAEAYEDAQATTIIRENAARAVLAQAESKVVSHVQ